MTSRINQISFGEFIISIVGLQGVVESQRGRNTVVYEGIDLLASMIGGAAPDGLNVMYFEFENDNATPGSIVQPVINLADGRSYYAALEGNAAATKRDYLRISLSAVPTISSSDTSIYEGNRALFIATSLDQSQGEGGLNFNVASLSTVYGIALVNAPDPNDRTQDRVFARSYDFDPKVLGANEQVDMQWRHTITV